MCLPGSMLHRFCVRRNIFVSALKPSEEARGREQPDCSAGGFGVGVGGHRVFLATQSPQTIFGQSRPGAMTGQLYNVSQESWRTVFHWSARPLNPFERACIPNEGVPCRDEEAIKNQPRHTSLKFILFTP